MSSLHYTFEYFHARERRWIRARWRLSFWLLLPDEPFRIIGAPEVRSSDGGHGNAMAHMLGGRQVGEKDATG